ncbi:UvrD-helicase domain-containing protein [Staphylococcus ursi]|uniref:HelD family protein n=1 Tax=Staphylococcus sp. MI 10-1553 TaxID=1912064 RepID=UPI0013981858|nr:UvrD-helicase domain-containing protein [Staphylococcus sp. MI 10-1553]QHW37057.1 UvrD-helicase domain-containing protein [Staphylococcus sp. MI 10-1553]
MLLNFNDEKNFLKETVSFIENEIKSLNSYHLNVKKKIINQRKKMNDNENWMLNFDSANAVDNVQDLTFLRSEESNYNHIDEKLTIYKRLLNRPYFGKIMLEEESIYIGTQTIVDNDYNILVCDWRAPIASLFYETGVGDLQYKSEDGRKIKEYVKGRRQFKIKNGELLSFVDSDVFIGDSELINYKIKSTDSKLTNIVNTIQQDQNEIIRLPINEDVLVLGPPGSGKTAIAMQRIAYLLFKYKHKITHDNLMFIAPNRIFNDYVSNVLPELGEKNIQIDSLKSMIAKILYFKNMRVESKARMIDRLYASKEDSDVFYKKTSGEFLDFMRDELAEDKCDFHFKDVKDEQHHIIINSTTLQSMFLELREKHDVKTTIQKIKNRLVNAYNKEYQKIYKTLFIKLNSNDAYIGEKSDLDKQAKKEASRMLKRAKRTINNYQFIDIPKMYRDICHHYQLDFEYKQKEMYQEDFWALVWLYTKIIKVSNNDFKHILIDEVQDYSIIQLDIIHQLFPEAHFTFLGDMNQSFLVKSIIDFSKMTINTKTLTTSYRSTKSINRYLQTLKSTDTKVVGEEGKDVVEASHVSTSYIIDIVTQSSGSVAIVVPSQKEAQSLYEELSDNIEIYLIEENDTFVPEGNVLIPYYLVKGFEYHTVISWGHHHYNQNIKYIIGSRAISQLYLIDT